MRPDHPARGRIIPRDLPVIRRINGSTDQRIRIWINGSLNTECSGLLGPDERAAREEDRGKNKVADINIKGLQGERAGLYGVLGDVSTVQHPISGTAPHKPDPRASGENGASVKQREKEKNDKYRELAERRDFAFEPMCVETYGRLGQSFNNILHEIAVHTAGKCGAFDSLPAARVDVARRKYFARKHRQYIRRVSIVRVRGLALRIKGAYFALMREEVERAAARPEVGQLLLAN